MKMVLGKWMVGVALSACASVSLAAPILWADAMNTQGPSDVVTFGTLVEAVNATASAGTTSVNGVEFANVAELIGGDFSGALAGGTTGDAGYNALLNTFSFGGGTSTSIELASGLLAGGSQYILQVWYTDLRSCCSGRVMTFSGDGGATVDVSASGTGQDAALGQYALGLFTADSSSQTLNLATNGFANAHVSGYQVRAVPSAQVPVPGTLLLFGLGLLGLGMLAGRRS